MTNTPIPSSHPPHPLDGLLFLTLLTLGYLGILRQTSLEGNSNSNSDSSPETIQDEDRQLLSQRLVPPLQALVHRLDFSSHRIGQVWNNRIQPQLPLWIGSCWFIYNWKPIPSDVPRQGLRNMPWILSMTLDSLVMGMVLSCLPIQATKHADNYPTTWSNDSSHTTKNRLEQTTERYDPKITTATATTATTITEGNRLLQTLMEKDRRRDPNGDDKGIDCFVVISPCNKTFQ